MPSYPANALASQRSASVAGKIVPCQAGLVGGGASSLSLGAPKNPATRCSPVGSWRSTGGGAGSLEVGLVTAVAEPRIVQGLLTSGWISLNLDVSAGVGSQVCSSGGPKMAQLCKWRANAALVNLASREAEAQSGAVVKARRGEEW